MVRPKLELGHDAEIDTNEGRRDRPSPSNAHHARDGDVRGRHLDMIGDWCVIGSCPAMAKLGAGIGDEAVGAFDPFNRIGDRRLAVIVVLG